MANASGRLSKILRIRELRQKAGMTQGTLAASLGVAQNVLCMWEAETVLPRTRDLPRLARVLGCQIGDLFTEDPEEDEEAGA